MSQSKEEIAKILAKRKTRDQYRGSTWNDLVSGMQTLTAQQKSQFVNDLVNGRQKAVYNTLTTTLQKNASERARTMVDNALTDNALSLSEIESLL